MKGKTILPLALLLAAVFTACSGGNSATMAAAPSAAAEYKGEMDRPEEPAPDMALSTTLRAAGVYEDAKLIQRADYEVQTTDYPAAETALEALVERCGGYFEYQETSGGGYYESAARRWGSFTIRVPKEQYDAFTGSVGEVGHVVSQSGSAEDVGQNYSDIELRLQTQRTKQERLLALLEKAATMEDIISLENALSETEYQIEQYTSDLKRYDSLIDFATIELRLTEVARISDEPGEVAPLGTRVASAFGEGLHSFGDGLGNLAVWLAYHAVGVAAFLAVLAGAGLAVRRRLRKRGAVRAPSDAQTEETEGR
ncbi:DUF4349 domain-containing protein [Intestinimonas massiliensis (ex Afouda et al. 2020)]|uniref:DUF4349 domain-containing protein n=1 Tax=Intestinimonas massiliensis (ex Afouda et al. 2020) TaxID=1673721 RepID=A0ABS9MAF8_9FIRM|nr:DUF4349 domain-containing protein [Intestinimonas massiliensis (ex Afouda et al. 2020)]MCG4527787.1 DUF4349 domain-containing protein [Intestinimonas massiliensis (ex Afouda et al. 2020)]